MGTKRRALPEVQKNRLYEKNGNSCCICKSTNIGLNLHHIDQDPSNNNDDNIAVLCVQEHDLHHRPSRYNKHLDLTKEVISQKKKNWESFIQESKKDHPNILAVINAFGDKTNITAIRIIFQWADSGNIEFQKDFNYLDHPIEEIVDLVINEVHERFGKTIKLCYFDKIENIDHCTNKHGALSRIINSNYATRLTALDWTEKAICSLYINPKQASMALHISYNSNETLYSCLIHKCGTDFHIQSEDNNIRIPFFRKKIRTQLTLLVSDIIFKEWGISPNRCIIGTGSSDKPTIIDKMSFPKAWEE